MKTWILLLAFTGISLQNLQARKNLFIGIKGGLSIPSLRAGESENDWNKNYTSRLGPYFGAFAEIPLGKHFAFQPELAYAAEGGKRKGIQPITIPEQYQSLFQQAFRTDRDYLYADLNTVSRVNYIQLPLLLKFSYPIAARGRLQVFAQAGPYLGYLVAARQLVRSDNLRVYLDGQGDTEIPAALVHNFFGTAIDTVIDARSDLHRFNTGVQGALGCSYTFGKSKVFIEGGGNYGFLYIQKGDEHGKNVIGAGTVLAGFAIDLNGIHKTSRRQTE